jgi:predicted nucleotidyltransferase
MSEQTKSLKTLTSISERYQISAIYSFGSKGSEVAALVKGEAVGFRQMKSDVDIGILPQSQVMMSPKHKVQLSTELEELLDIYRIDLIILPDADPFLAVNIIRGERIYCADEYRVDEYELYVLRRAGDLIPLEQERIRLILGED